MIKKCETVSFQSIFIREMASSKGKTFASAVAVIPIMVRFRA